MAIPLDPKQVVSFEELLMSQVIQQEALTRLLTEKGIFTQEEFLGLIVIQTSMFFFPCKPLIISSKFSVLGRRLLWRTSS